uniref:Uncharacterized protein n=1 Tax=Utricularia reniformis TaxID=192314 RepID=A0A1Y0B0D4_9LAMI|nr:hypothetical protein AEK19_MT0639 [Utricularia reniformis]ART30892.1 hypothetical protein AEK19_MT0639 [Utricularia reniformis]
MLFPDPRPRFTKPILLDVMAYSEFETVESAMDLGEIKILSSAAKDIRQVVSLSFQIKRILGELDKK